MTPNTTSAPAPAPSAASETAKQLASFITRTARPSRASRSPANGFPMSATEFAFFTSPVSGTTVPGMPTPTGPCAPAVRSTSATTPATASTVPS
jgi:hypothetical protein